MFSIVNRYNTVIKTTVGIKEMTLFKALVVKANSRIEAGEDVVEVVFDIVNFDEQKPDVEAHLKEDPTLAERIDDQGHNSVVYPDDATESDIVITNLQEQLISHFEY